jgi:endonuclease YncB( thermonuclease family)
MISLLFKRRRRRRGPLWTLLLVAAAIWQLWQHGLPPPDAPRRSGPAATAFESLQGARLLPYGGNDGDSFKVEHRGLSHHFRLYFADCAETHRNAKNADRVRDQGRAFGGLDEARTLALGREAVQFTRSLLQAGGFVIHTRWQRVYDSNRFYAFITFPDGEDLSEKLVRAGLARIHTTGTTLPDGRSARQFEARLRSLEHEARTARRGAWRH